ncbi:multidrug/biocide efflux PACE transporter [Vogesella oryzae]|uniref:multidrug/biocide efflux PACE transporter n=1 Tax=Vogesella oryzae TaxID=1735285 RepID=UPI001582BF3F|nr:multidrug/biocide efflux PACE transporter [Vogesella oryzae]
MQHDDKTLRERIFHAVLYEVCAMALLVPLGSWLGDADLAHIGALGLMMSTIAMLWNMLFNALFERLERRYHWQRNPTVRSLHAIGFEGGMLLLTIPLVAWWLECSLWQALLLDVGVLLFFLPYTYVFNWSYDHTRARLMARRVACRQA